MMDDIKLEKYIDNTLAPILPEKIKGGNNSNAGAAADNRMASLGTSSKYSTKQQSPSNTIIGKTNLD
jgi:hypothetical protein